MVSPNCHLFICRVLHVVARAQASAHVEVIAFLILIPLIVIDTAEY